MIPNKEKFSGFIFPLLVIAIIVAMIGCKSTETMSDSDEMMAEETSPMVQEMITALPVPAAAYGSTPIDQEKGYLVEELGEGLYYDRGYVSCNVSNYREGCDRSGRSADNRR